MLNNIKQEVIDAANERFKEFFKEHYYKSKKEGNGMKATNQSTSLTFYIKFDCYSNWYQEQNNVDSSICAKLPYTDYEILRYDLKFAGKDVAQSIALLEKVFTDNDFLEMLDWNLPDIYKIVE